MARGLSGGDGAVSIVEDCMVDMLLLKYFTRAASRLRER
jgi:hypothetical protein